MNINNDFRLCDAEQVIVSFYIAVPVGKPFAAVIGFLQPMPLNHGAHSAVNY